MENGEYNISLIQGEGRAVINKKSTPSVETEGGKPKPTAYEKIVIEILDVT